MKVDVVIRVEVADQKAAESWAASVCEMVRPKCPTCRGKGEIEGAPFPYRSNRTCPHCDGRGSLPHPYKPEVMDRTECDHANAQRFDDGFICDECMTAKIKIHLPKPANHVVIDIDTGRTLTEAEVAEFDSRPIPAPQCECEGECGRHDGTRCPRLATHPGNGLQTCKDCAEY